MKKIAVIDRIVDETIYATYNKSDNGGHSRAFIKIQEDLSFKIRNSRNIFIKKGDLVEIFIEPKGAIGLTFFMFIMPLIAFMVFYSTSGLILPDNSELFKITSGIAGIVLSFVSTYLFFKIRPQKLPDIIRKLKSSELAPACSTGCGACSSCG